MQLPVFLLPHSLFKRFQAQCEQLQRSSPAMSSLESGTCLTQTELAPRPEMPAPKGPPFPPCVLQRLLHEKMFLLQAIRSIERIDPGPKHSDANFKQ